MKDAYQGNMNTKTFEDNNTANKIIQKQRKGNPLKFEIIIHIFFNPHNITMADYDQSNYYRSHEIDSENQKYERSHGINSENRKYKLSSSRQRQNKESRGKYHEHTISEDKYDYSENTQQMKAEIQRLKKALKQSNAKRSCMVRECSEYQKQISNLQSEIERLGQRADEQKIDKQGDRYRVEQLRFLNKQLGDEINELRDENQTLMDKVRYCSEVVEKKYEQLEEKMMKRMQQAMKRVKKAVHYLQTLSIKDIDKTKDILIENLKKANDLLKGKYTQDHNAEHQIQQLMNPLKTLQQELSQKSKQLNHTKNQNKKLIEQVKKHKRIEHQLLPQYKQSIEGLKKNLAQVRAQLSQNQVEKLQIKKKYQQKIRNIEQHHHQLLIQYRKNKLLNKIFQNKLQELQEEKQQEKERLVGENQMLKKLYDLKHKTSPLHHKSQKNSQHLQNFQDQQADQQLPQKQTDLKPQRIKNFKRKPYHQQGYDQNDSNMDNYRADYYNNHKTTKNTYADQPIQEKKELKNNHSYKQLKAVTGNRGRQMPQELSRVKKDTGVRSVRNFSKQKPNNNPDRKPTGQKARSSKHRLYHQSDQEEQQKIYKSDDSNKDYQYGQEEDSQFYRDQSSSMISQQSLKDEICRIDQQIMEIQKNLTKQLQAYK